MDIKTAIEVVKNYGNGLGINDFLEVLQEMQLQQEQENLSLTNEIALKTVMITGAQMFAPV